MRQITPDDVDRVYDIYMDPVVNPYMGFGPVAKRDFQPIYQMLLDRDHFWLFQDEGQDCGICSLVFGKGRMDHVATIMSLGVRKDFQGKGLGRKILQDVIDFAKTKQAKRIELIVEADNPKALQFYKNMGFNVEGTCAKAFRRENSSDFVDQVIMALAA